LALEPARPEARDVTCLVVDARDLAMKASCNPNIEIGRISSSS
jgi:hypothetical protein